MSLLFLSTMFPYIYSTSCFPHCIHNIMVSKLFLIPCLILSFFAFIIYGSLLFLSCSSFTLQTLFLLTKINENFFPTHSHNIYWYIIHIFTLEACCEAIPLSSSFLQSTAPFVSRQVFPNCVSVPPACR